MIKPSMESGYSLPVPGIKSVVVELKEGVRAEKRQGRKEGRKGRKLSGERWNCCGNTRVLLGAGSSRTFSHNQTPVQSFKITRSLLV